ncbi:MAG: hypothetical protein LBG11_12220 [Bifidobacteriaceae bacterium]|nr:hypothetical protein [Bifidobacteriaceae bacterium]
MAFIDSDRKGSAAVLDPGLPVEELATIAAEQPGLQVRVAWHPNVDQTLLTWLRDQGQPAAARVARVRLAARTVAPPPAPSSQPPVPVPDAAVPPPTPTPAGSPAAQPEAEASQAPTALAAPEPVDTASTEAKSVETEPTQAGRHQKTAAPQAPAQAEPIVASGDEPPATIRSILSDVPLPRRDQGGAAKRADRPPLRIPRGTKRPAVPEPEPTQPPIQSVPSEPTKPTTRSEPNTPTLPRPVVRPGTRAEAARRRDLDLVLGEPRTPWPPRSLVDSPRSPASSATKASPAFRPPPRPSASKAQPAGSVRPLRRGAMTASDTGEGAAAPKFGPLLMTILILAVLLLVSCVVVGALMVGGVLETATGPVSGAAATFLTSG